LARHQRPEACLTARSCAVQNNPHEIRGALVEGSSTGFDDWPDVRTRNESRVALENNAGFTAAVAGLNELKKPTWPQVRLCRRRCAPVARSSADTRTVLAPASVCPCPALRWEVALCVGEAAWLTT